MRLIFAPFHADPQLSGQCHYVDGSDSSDFADEMRAHDLLQISGLADLVYVGWDLPEKRCPLWVERSPFVVVRRANLFDGMIPVGVRGSSRQQRSAAYLAPKSIRNRITPEQLAANQGWLTNARTEEIPGFKVLAGIEEKLA